MKPVCLGGLVLCEVLSMSLSTATFMTLPVDVFGLLKDKRRKLEFSRDRQFVGAYSFFNAIGYNDEALLKFE